ncbi:MAG: type II toxin-antitoxin system YoeB family toxin [Candidatus Daviesbacteria bacterium]|nr:type II toxin-antitoxin system YoeB family toxin [Candidatus Daviesbacteria bacterium]
MVEQREEIFRKDPFDKKLKTHKLKGELKDFYSFSISYHFRIVFHFEGKDIIVFDNVGTHRVYK